MAFDKTVEHNKFGTVPQHGKKPNQKLKPYLVLQYLLRHSDENHVISARSLAECLQGIGIDAERRSIYRDIEEINKAMIMAEKEMDLDEAEEELEQYGDEARYIVYNTRKKGFYVRERRFEFDEVRLAAETIYASKYLTENESKTLVDLVCSFVSDYQAEEIKHDVYLSDRVKTNNKNTFKNIATINSAKRKEIDGVKHLPDKISFKYLKYSINDVKQQIERHPGERYVVSPYALLLNDGYYYLIAYSDHVHDLRTYRVDRMKDVRLTNEGIDIEARRAFKGIDIESFTRRAFSMYSGKQERVTLQFINKLLDAVIDRFGTNGVNYYKVDEDHFAIVLTVDISDQFFGWLCGFGEKVEITSPKSVRNEYSEYLKKIILKYE